MELKEILRDVKSIEGGRWVGADEVPGMGDVKVKVGGYQTQERLERTARLEREGVDRNEAIARVVREDCFKDISGLTSEGKPLSADDVRPYLDDPAWAKVATWVVSAVKVVDDTTQAKAEALAKN